MDAKPQRPLRTRAHDENAVPVLNQAKTVHQRHKSTPALSTLMQLGAQKAKRSAFQDVSNQRQIPSKDDVIVNGKNGGIKEKAASHVPDLVVKDNLTRKPQRVTVHKPSQSLSSNPVSITSASINATSFVPVKSAEVARVQPEPARTVYQKQPVSPLKEESPSIDEILAEHDREFRAIAAAEAFAQAQQESVNSNPLASHPVLPSEPASFLPPTSAFPETHEQAQQALQAVLAHEQQLEAQAQARAQSQALAQAIPRRSQGYEEYDGASHGDYTTGRSLNMGSDTTGGATIFLGPKYTTAIRAEIAAAKELVEASRTPEEIEDDQWDMSMVAEYGEEIFDYMRVLEERMRPNPHYMDLQTECQWSMRAVLLDWLVQVHARFQLLPETLFLSVNYIDRFLSCKVVSLAKLQLVGATALFLAAKYEEVNCPSISEIVYMVDNGYTMDEILKAERFMLSMLAFELGWPGPMSFLRRISKADDYDLETRTLAKYFLEVTIMDERFVGCPPSSTAAAAHCLARQMLRKGDWTPAHVYYSNYTYAQLRPLTAVMVECCEDPNKHHAAVFAKYQDKRYKKASYFVQTEMQAGFVLQPLPGKQSTFGMMDLSLSNGWRAMS
ncbi:cyclin-like protein [Elsinoe ampelina]|uniref:Cyclin-like protein n=1 Tax=Elsinoe ampelina TaxID=302913 RepID=A0A6A6GJU0_9PEZI|nr:cyclin-like protein [Elsinoe ampelina]